MANVSSSNGLEKRPKLRFPGFDGPYRNLHIFLRDILVKTKTEMEISFMTKSDVLSVSGE